MQFQYKQKTHPLRNAGWASEILVLSFYPHCSADVRQQHMAHMQWVNIQTRIRGRGEEGNTDES